uniref:Uncharacterized protein n=1 Tax=Piliocolobus tephrosceles TaxID=591936 RepID=A0A8C9LWA8_9PRIM
TLKRFPIRMPLRGRQVPQSLFFYVSYCHFSSLCIMLFPYNFILYIYFLRWRLALSPGWSAVV